MTSPEKQTSQSEPVAHWAARLPDAVVDLREGGPLEGYTHGTVTAPMDSETPAGPIAEVTFADHTKTAIVGDHPTTGEEVVVSINPDSGESTHVTVIPPR